MFPVMIGFTAPYLYPSLHPSPLTSNYFSSLFPCKRQMSGRISMSSTRRSRAGRRMVHVRRKPIIFQTTVVRKKLKELMEIVPGCLELDFETLLMRTADYITLLEFKVMALRALSDIYRV